MELLITTNVTALNAGPMSMRCPRCRQLGTFEIVGIDLHFQTSQAKNAYVGHRKCPNPSCNRHIFVVFDENRRLVISYPPARIDFDPKGVPSQIIASIEEAITCRANDCFIASAIMVRKTLELLCAAQNVSGKDLKERIKALGSKAILPADLFAGLNDLRLLGNDAAHVESKEYAQITSEEVDVAIEFTKEVLKAIYQFSDMLARIKSLKRLPPSP